ncbi:MAG TPA: hypothetical protein ENK91_09660, partial [Bacteroidetes bacterium]|nr:hypothetical protein [Bacteroidota bacterium]
MKNSKTLILLFSLFFSFNLFAQNDIELKGYVNAENNAGFIENGDVYIYQNDTLNLVNHLKTDEY